jgi:hypothetical protein
MFAALTQPNRHRIGNTMAAPRHAQKPVWSPAAIGLGVAAALLMALLAARPSEAATTEYIVVDRNTGLAIHGYDPLAYFVNGAPALGKGEFEYRYAGAVWRFLNPGNLGAFAADPDVYMPRFGGYDPIGLARGSAIAGDPRFWIIIQNRLYLFQSAENRATFAQGGAPAVAAADAAWPAIQRTLSP